ncbi:MAG: TolC family protein [Armatimonadetes bacterium]|nr:TolC family protein [Armatimonadota bacterium]
MFVLYGIAVAMSQAQVPQLSLEQALEIAASNAFSVRLATADSDRAREQASEIAGRLSPSLRLTGSYIKIGGAITGTNSGNAGGGLLQVPAVASSPTDFKQLELTVTQVIDILGVQRKGLAAARMAHRASEQIVQVERNSLKETVRQQFFGVLQAQALVAVQRDELESARARTANAKIRFEFGAVSKFDVLRLETEEKRSEQALLDAEANFVIGKQNLNNVIGRAVQTEFSPGEVAGVPTVRVSPDRAVELAFQRRPVLASLEFARSSSRLTRQMEEGALKPSLMISAQFRRIIDPLPGQPANGAFALVSLSFPLHDSGATRSRVRAAQDAEDRISIQVEQAKLAISLDVRRAITLMETAGKAHDVALSGYELAREALRLAQLLYDEGAGILLDVTTAQSEQTRAQASVVTTRYEFWRAYAAIQKAVGIDDLRELAMEVTN